jgi:hypothetical protein
MALQKQITVVANPIRVRASGDAQVLVQNLGPDAAFIGNDSSVTPANGVKVLRLGSYTSPEDMVESKSQLWVVSEGTSDIRVMRVG